MIISLTAMAFALSKLICLVGIAGFSAMMVLWPINDQPTSRGQYITWYIILTLASVLMFTDWITFTK